MGGAGFTSTSTSTVGSAPGAAEPSSTFSSAGAASSATGRPTVSSPTASSTTSSMTSSTVSSTAASPSSSASSSASASVSASVSASSASASVSASSASASSVSVSASESPDCALPWEEPPSLSAGELAEGSVDVDESAELEALVAEVSESAYATPGTARAAPTPRNKASAPMRPTNADGRARPADPGSPSRSPVTSPAAIDAPHLHLRPVITVCKDKRNVARVTLLHKGNRHHIDARVRRRTPPAFNCRQVARSTRRAARRRASRHNCRGHRHLECTAHGSLRRQ